MLRECSPPRKHIRNRLSVQCTLRQEARYSVLWLDSEDVKESALTHTIQVTMNNRKSMHYGVLCYPAVVMISATHSSATR